METGSQETELEIGDLLALAADQAGDGAAEDAAATQASAADLARGLVATYPDDVRLREGLAAVTYQLGSRLHAVGDLAGAVAALDESEAHYTILVGDLLDAEVRRADVRARRGLAQAVRGRAASAIVDADAAVLSYLEETGGDADHPRWADLARVLTMNAAVLVRHGDPDLAGASAAAALDYYGYAISHGLEHSPEEVAGYLNSAAAVVALSNLRAGRIGAALLPTQLLVGNLPSGDGRRDLEREVATLDADDPVPDSPDRGRDLARVLAAALRGRGLLWVPDDAWLDGEPAPTLAAVLERRVTPPDGDALIAELTAGQPPELLWTSSMRWLPDTPLDTVAGLVLLAVEVLADAYEDGRRLALESHAMLAAAYADPDVREVPTDGTDGPDGAAGAAGATGEDGPDEPPAVLGPVWLDLLERAGTAAAEAGDDGLAADLHDLRTRRVATD